MDSLLQPIFESPIFILVQQLCGLFFVVIFLALIFWTARDARKRGAMWWFWAVVVLFFNLAGWAVYMVVRPPEYLDDVRERALEMRATENLLRREMTKCPACLHIVEPDFLVCPFCMKMLKKACGGCERPLALDWNVCPYCKEKQNVKVPSNPPSPKRKKPKPSTSEG